MRNMKHWFSPSVLCLAVPALVAALGCATEARDDKKVIIIGIDGMDPRLLEQFIAEDRMPNFERLAADGDFTPLQTSMPPLSPVAWSTFITGMDPGGHGTYDFLHRDPDTYAPVESIYRVVPPGRSVELGSWVIPLSGGGYELLRKGRAGSIGQCNSGRSVSAGVAYPSVLRGRELRRCAMVLRSACV